MRDSAYLGLAVRDTSPDDPNEQSGEIHLVGINGDLVAWFKCIRRTSGGQQIVSTNTQFVQRDELLTFEQISFVNEWLIERSVAARWGLISYTKLVEAA